MVILGIDPGIATVGFGVLDFSDNKYRLIRCGVITTPAHTPLSARLEMIYSDLNELICAFRPDVVSVEELFFNTNITTGISVAHGRGVILLACQMAGLKIYEYTPLQASGRRLWACRKAAGNGYGEASVQSQCATET